LRAAAVGGGAYAVGKRRARNQEEAAAGQVEEPEQPAATEPSGLSEPALDELGKLGALKDQGVLTQEEFDAQKAKILASA
jgi:hypothetical protein